MMISLRSRKLLILIIATLTLIITVSRTYAASMNNANERASYTIGYDLGYNYSHVSDLINTDLLLEGLEAGLNDGAPKLSVIEMQYAMAEFRKNINSKLAENQKRISEDNLKNSNKYLAKISRMSGVKKITDGLYYKVIQDANGDKPKLSDKIVVQFQGKLVNGEVFYDTFRGNVKETYPLSTTLLAWQKAIVKMPVGATWNLYVAPELGYGISAPANIGPNQALIYKIKLVGIK